MKNFKKVTAAIAATLMAATMVAPMALNSFAADGDEPTTSASVTSFALTVPDGVTIKDNKVNAYQLFKLEFDANEMVTKIEWADGVSDAIKNAIKTAVNVTAENASASDVATKITEGENGNCEAVARAVTNAITTEGAIQGDYSEGNVTFTKGLANGYYLFTCTGTKNVLGTDMESISLGMLTIANGAATANTVGKGKAKVGLPTVEKKVLEDDNEATSVVTYETDKKWNDVADLEIGQEAKFGLYGTLPENYENYENYSYEFVDHLDGVFVKPEESSFKVTASGATISSEDYTITIIDAETGGYDISVKFANLKTNETVTKDTQITVKYTTALTDAAQVCKVNPNEVSLKYSNNPNKSGTGEFDNDDNKEETPKDKVGVYTYDFQFKKTFWNAGSDLTEEEIKAGEFSKLKFGVTGKKFKKVEATDTENYGKYDYIVTDAEDGITDLELTLIDDKGERVAADTDLTEVDVKDYKLVVRIKGLDSDKYTITEDNDAWTEYNAIKAEEGEFEIKTNLVQKQDESTFANVTEDYSENIDNYFEIQNKKGTTLPSTGGIGTTLFYLGGGAMVAVAGVFLITKKRMGKDEA